MSKSNEAFERKKQEVVMGAARLPATIIEDDDDEEMVKEKQKIVELEVYNCMVHNGADGLNHVPKKGIPAAELIMLQYVHGSEFIKNIKLSKVKSPVQTNNIQAYLRDYLSVRYGDGKVEYLWGNGLTGKDIPLTLADPIRTGALADAQRAAAKDENDFLGGKRIA